MTGTYEFKRWRGEWSETPKGYWATTAGESPVDWKVRSVFLACPLCGEVGGLPHAINAEGRITPSVVCPNEPKCPMHVSPARLLEWDLKAKPPER